MWTNNTGITPYFFVGEVVDKDDPLNLGRVRVRAIGLHPADPENSLDTKDEKDDVEDQDLPWAPCINGTYGKMNMVPDEGDWVFGFFVDGRDAQHPMLLGTIPGMNTDDSGAVQSDVGGQTYTGQQATNDGATPTPIPAGEPIDTDSDVLEIIETGKGYNIIKMEDGTIVRREGARNWRNNNPGNIEYGAFAKSMGAIGTDGRFAIFPNYETGRRAKETLLFETSSYKNLSLSDAINRYAPSFENDTASYISNVATSAGISADTKMGDIPPAQRDAILDAFERQEGFKVGNTKLVSGG